MEAKITYTVEMVNRAFGQREEIPWGADWVNRFEGLTEQKAIKRYKVEHRWCHPDGPYGGYGGHVRIIGSDDWTYTVEPPEPGERATLTRMYHLDDL
jgi:hypothetical protein